VELLHASRQLVFAPGTLFKAQALNLAPYSKPGFKPGIISQSLGFKLGTLFKAQSLNLAPFLKAQALNLAPYSKPRL